MDFDADYTRYQTERSLLRKWVRRAYLRSAASQLTGPTLDFGCGVGELLQRLPAGSRGLEYNPATVAYCQHIGLPVQAYDGFADDWNLGVLPADCRLESMVISHVLEHLDDPMDILRRLLKAATRHGVRKVLVIVPGKAGYRIDSTHRTFVDRAMLLQPSITEDSGFAVHSARWFPGNLRAIGDWFPHHELQVVFER